jgi:hypothetical protein
MASADIEKVAVFDSRIVQSRPKFAVDKGALSVTNAPFQALSQTSSQHTYSVQVPSETTFVDRAVNWSSQVGIAITITGTFVAGSTYTIGQQGTSTATTDSFWGWCAFPLQSLTSTIQATINDTNVVLNSSDVLKEVLRLVDIRANTLQRTTPTKLDTYASALDDARFVNSTYGSYLNSGVIQEEAPNSWAWTSGDARYGGSTYTPYVTQSSGSAVVMNTAIAVSTGSTASWTAVGGGTTSTLQFNYDGSLTLVVATANITSFTIYVAPYFTEKLVLSPFVFSDIHERDTGLFGIQNIQFVMNMRNPADCRLVRQRQNSAYSSGGNASYVVSSAYNTAGSTFQNSRLDVVFLTPSLSLPLPPKSVVPYMEYPRYITSNAGTIGSGATNQTFSTQTITLPQIPDLLVIYAKPQSYSDATQGDWYFPVQSVSLQWDNYAGLMSTMSQQQLYEMSVENGLSQDYQQWSGRLPAGRGVAGATTSGSAVVQSVGGALVIRPGKDFALQEGQAPSLVGNYTLQVNLGLANFSGSTGTPTIYVMTINSGFFESVKGTSRVVKGILSEADIISAPISSLATRSQVERAVGGSFLSKLGHAVSKALPHLPSVARVVAPLVKPHLPSVAQQGLSMLGYGEGEGDGSHSASGGRRRQHKASHRLM